MMSNKLWVWLWDLERAIIRFCSLKLLAVVGKRAESTGVAVWVILRVLGHPEY